MASEQFSLCWDNFHKNMSSGMNSLLENEDLVDVTLAVEGKCLKAHKMVLSVCSPYFKELFKSNPCQHPIVFMKDVSYVALSDLLQFMYQGEVQVSQENLTTFIKTAEALQIKGLTGDGNGSTDADESVSEDKTVHHQIEEYKPTPRPKKQPAPSPVVTTTPAPKRQRLSVSSESSQPLPPVITKPEPVSTPAASTTEPIQFKMEPYDQSHTLGMHDDNPDDTFGDDTLDDTNVDDTEDYSMMEGGEEEPQAGTSTDGAGEGQVNTKEASNFLKTIVGGSDCVATDIDKVGLLTVSKRIFEESSNSDTNDNQNGNKSGVHRRRNNDESDDEFSEDHNKPISGFDTSSCNVLPGISVPADIATISMLTSILHQVEQIRMVQDQILFKIDMIERAQPATSFQDPPNMPSLPISNKMDVKELETFLADESNFVYMQRRLAAIGGTNVRNTVRNILRFILTNRVAMEFNWCGRDKIPFKNTEMMQVINEAVKLYYSGRPNSQSLTDNDINSAVKDWLKLAKQRFLSTKVPSLPQ